jgi:dTDP-4-dehydrorhamnose reductase
MLGRELVRAAAARRAVLVPWGPADFDVTISEAVLRAVEAARPDVVIHAAAWTDVDACEADPGRAFRVNAGGTENVAAACGAVGARLVTVSTDYVFDGTKDGPYAENDAPSPLSVYGRSKLAAEEATRALGGRGCVARTAWLYADHGRNFFLTMLRLASERDAIDVVDDQHGSPTFAADAAEALLDLAARSAAGTFHVTNAGATTWCGFARRIMVERGLATRIVAVTTDRVPRPARRPRRAVLAAEAIGRLGLAPLPAWEDGLRRCVARLVPARIPGDGTGDRA